jgi:hypothetical protein
MSNLSLSMPCSPLLIDAHFKQRFSEKSVVRATRGEVLDVIINNPGEASGWFRNGEETKKSLFFDRLCRSSSFSHAWT